MADSLVVWAGSGLGSQVSKPSVLISRREPLSTHSVLENVELVR